MGNLVLKLILMSTFALSAIGNMSAQGVIKPQIEKIKDPLKKANALNFEKACCASGKKKMKNLALMKQKKLVVKKVLKRKLVSQDVKKHAV